MLNGLSFPTLIGSISGVPVALAATTSTQDLFVPVSMVVTTVIFVAVLTHKWTKGQTSIENRIGTLERDLMRIRDFCRFTHGPSESDKRKD